VGSDRQIDKLDSPLDLRVDVLNLLKLTAREHVLDVAPPVALFADVLQQRARLLEQLLHGLHLQLIKRPRLLKAQEGLLEGDHSQVKLGNLLVVL